MLGQIAFYFSNLPLADNKRSNHEKDGLPIDVKLHVKNVLSRELHILLLWMVNFNVLRCLDEEIGETERHVLFFQRDPFLYFRQF